MDKFNADIFDYDPREHRLDLSGVLSGFLFVTLILTCAVFF